jgi:hypothetical protein
LVALAEDLKRRCAPHSKALRAHNGGSMSLEIKISVTALCAFFLAALLTGVWKYVWVMRGPNHRAPVYVDIAHHAAMHYSFATMILILLLQLIGASSTINLIATLAILLFFAIAIVTYIQLGFVNHTDNQFRERNLGNTLGMYALIAAEVGGFLILASAALAKVWS